jgi:hypothetical protein
MAEFKVTPTIIGGSNYFEVHRWIPGALWGGRWRWEAYAQTKAEAERICEHLGGPITMISTVGKTVEESK